MSNATPSGVREALALHIASQLGAGYDVLERVTTDAPATRPRVMVAIREVSNADVGCPVRSVGLDVWALSALTADAAAEDDVDHLLGLILDALDVAPRTSWTTAERGVFGDSTLAYRIEVETRA